MPEEEIRRAGRWVQGTSKMHQYYLSSLPVPFARAIAGFGKKPFYLKRNDIVPSLDLQRRIFPFIEGAYDAHGEEARQRWRAECRDVMNEVEVDDEDSLEHELQDIKDNWLTIRVSQRGQVATRTPGIAKKNFLKLLLRLRRVILQDAVIYMDIGLKGPILSHDIFLHDPDFTAFRAELSKHMSTPRVELPTEIPPGLIAVLQGNSSAVEAATRQTTILQQQVAELRRLLHQGLTASSNLRLTHDQRHNGPLPHIAHPTGWHVSPVHQENLAISGQQPVFFPGPLHQGQAPPQPTMPQPALATPRKAPTFRFRTNRELDMRKMASSIWESYKAYLHFDAHHKIRGVNPIADRDRRAKNDHIYIVQEIIFRIKTEQESGSGLSRKDAKEKVLKELDKEYIRVPKPGGWTAHSLYEYCFSRHVCRTKEGIRDPPPTLNDFVYEGDSEVECRFCPGA